MVYSRSASFGADVNTGLDATRLVYSLSPLSRSHGFELIPGHKRGERISEFEIRDIIKTLHPVDLEIVRELRSGTGLWERERSPGCTFTPPSHPTEDVHRRHTPAHDRN